MARRRSSRRGVSLVVPLAVLLLAPTVPAAAHPVVPAPQTEALSVDLGGSDQNPGRDADDRVELGGSDRNDRNDPPDSRPDPPPAPQPAPPPQPQPQEPEPVFTAHPDLPEGNAGSAEAVPSVDGDGWLPTEAPPQAAAVDTTQSPAGSTSAPTASAAASPPDGKSGDNPIGTAADADDPTASGSATEASAASVLLRWGGAVAAAVVAALGVLGLALLRARRSAD
ncbi:hypothetical protein [Brevibacterium yomogidense]|uniref:hypothetical protein n=1 Tax=Brevibacterium yomogidense TaxID=946573 RepID=UPI0018DF8692|nr:hypothetical protein [Brevibacterium yomogidense]